MLNYNAYLLLGGNQGDISAIFCSALLLIEERVGKIICSSGEYTSRAWGMPDNTSNFLNKAVCVSTALEPLELLKVCKNIEVEFGRNVPPALSTYASRTIDIDIIFYGNNVYNNPLLFIPHPLANVRRFVLEPLNEICSDYLHPVLGRTVGELLQEVS